MSEDKNKIPQNKPKEKEAPRPVNESFGESKKQQDDLRKGAEIPPKKKDK
ncbi:MAG: hypothetical protein ACI85Q_002359 [Salibacteraceae bacterium]|jgi:hypothetical protein